MTTYYTITAMIEMPDGLSARSAIIAKTAAPAEAFKAALEKQGLTPVISDKLTTPQGKRAPKSTEQAADNRD